MTKNYKINYKHYFIILPDVLNIYKIQKHQEQEDILKYKKMMNMN